MIMMINPELNLSRYKRMKAIHKDGFLFFNHDRIPGMSLKKRHIGFEVMRPYYSG